MEPTQQTPKDTLASFNLGAPSHWHPPKDPNKPSLPYLTGFSIQICRHAPPPVYATPEELDELGHEYRPDLEGGYLYTVTQSEAVALHPPVEGTTPSQTGTAQLAITSSIAIGAVRGVQVVDCAVTSDDGHRFMACAKIYDPLYYNFKSSIAGCPEDCVREADDDYIVATWAYNFLEQKTDQAGTLTPKFYGSWTFSLPITLTAKGVSLRRPIRLILVERLHGASIQGSRAQNSPAREALTDSFHFPEEYRLEVLARTMEGYVKLQQAGIEQKDFTGRNTFLVVDTERPPEQQERLCGLLLPRIVFVDYNNARLRRDFLPDEVQRRPDNPASEFWGDYLFHEIAGWMPGTWSKGQFQE